MMADLTLRHPANGANQVIPSEKFDHIAFDFPSDSVVLSKEGNDLLLSFEDGSRITLTDFYTTFSKDSIPDFIVDGTSVSGSEFFAALNEPDLMPAAGPAVAASNADGGRFHEYTDASLMDGVERLGGLDLGLNRAAEPDRELEAYGNRGVEEEEAVVEEVIVPERPLFNDAPSGGSSVVTTDEGNIPGMGSQHETSATQPFGAATDGSFKMELHGADATVSIGGTELKVENGKLYHNGVEVTADAAVSVPGGAHGTLTVTGMDADGTVHYTYTLTAPVDATGNASNRPGEGDAGRGEAVYADAFDVSITTTGGTATGQITVDALDDAPVLSTLDTTQTTVADSEAALTGTLSFTPGADAEGAQVTVEVEGQTFTGTVDKVNINGTTTNGFTTYPITIRLDGDGTELARQGLRPGMNVSATIIGQSVENALCVPVGAVSRGNKLLVAAPGALAEDGTTVLDPTKTEERQVALGASDDSYVQILSGLSQGETVLVPDQGQDKPPVATRNCFRGTVERVRQDEMLAEILVNLPDGSQACALHVRGESPIPPVGSSVWVIFKALSVILTLD